MTSIPSAATTIASKTPEEKAADYFREWKRWPDGPVPEEKESKSEDKGDNPKEEKQPFDLPVENPTYEKFTLEVKDKIGSGGFGQVNHGILHSSPDKDKKHEVAIKSSKDDKGRNPVEEEFAKYKDLELDVEFDMEKEEHIEKLKNADQFPHVFCGFRWPGHSEYYIMVLQRLGTNLHSVVRKMPKGNTMDHGDVADIGIKVIKILKRLHEAGYVHSDVKPENLLYGWNEDRGDDDREKLFLIDLGLAVKWKNDKQQSGPDNHVEYNQQPNNFRGTTQYASVHAHLGRTGSRRDDLQSLAYTLLFLKCGRLPWPEKRNYKELTGDSKEKKFKKRMCTCKTKMSYSPRRLSNLWEESTKEWFREFLELVMNLKFQEVPDYDKYISLLDKIKNKILKDYQEPSPATEDPPAWISVYNYQQSMKQRYHYNIAWDNKVISRYIKKDLDEKLFICSATSHEKLALITMEKTGYTKQEYMILDLDKLKDIKLDENYTITALAATGERWLVTMAQGTTFPNQKFCVASDFFPEKFIAENRGSFVTALAANEEKWAVVLSQSPVVSSEEEQVIEFDFCIPMEGLHERFKQGYKISMVAASKNQIAFVLSRPVTATSWTPKKNCFELFCSDQCASLLQVKKTDVRKNDTSNDATTKTSTNDSNKESAPAQDGGPEKVDEQEGKSMDRGKDATSKGARATCKISLIKSRDKTVFTTKYNAGSEQDGGSEEEPKQEIVFTKDFPKTSIKENWQKSMYVSSICYSRLEEKSFHVQQDLPSSGP